MEFALRVKMGLLVQDGLLPGILDALRKSLAPLKADETEVLLSEVVEVVPLRLGARSSASSGHP